MEVEETWIVGAKRGEEGRRRMELFIWEGFSRGGGFTKYLERVVEGTTKERDTREDVEGGGGGEFTTCVTTLEEGEE